MKNNLIKALTVIIFLSLSALFVIKVAGPKILKVYVEMGLGDCKKIPILCLVPEQAMIDPDIDKNYIQELTPQKFSDMELRVPKGFAVTKERVTRVYYKKRKHPGKGSAIYLLSQEPGFFPNLYPQIQKSGIKSNADFMFRITRATTSDIKNITDVFFAVMKTVFSANLGNENNIKIASLSVAGLKGFISYSFCAKGNYFDCNITDAEDHYFKVYIKDTMKTLDLDKVMAIISTVSYPAKNP